MSVQPTFRIGDQVIYKNNQLIAFNKPPGIPVQRDTSEDASLADLGQLYTKKPLLIIHRIDRPASGVVLMAKTKSALANLNEQFKARTVQKKYLVMVQGAPKQENGTLEHFLVKDSKRNKSLVYDELIKRGKKALLSYQLIEQIDHYSLLEIELKSGRHHQIRAQMAKIGCPIKGDVKYGAKRGNKDRSIQLHALELSFSHPVSGKKETIKAPLPKDSIWEVFKSFEVYVQ